MKRKYYLDWKEYAYTWTDKDWKWIDVYVLIEEAIGGGIPGGIFELDALDPWDSMQKKLREKKIEEEKISKIFEVIVSIKGENKRYKKNKEKEVKITIGDIQKTFNKYGHEHIQVKAKIKK